MLAVVTVDVLASIVGGLIVALVYLARQLARLAERVARLEGGRDRDW